MSAYDDEVVALPVPEGTTPLVCVSLFLLCLRLCASHLAAAPIHVFTVRPSLPCPFLVLETGWPDARVSRGLQTETGK